MYIGNKNNKHSSQYTQNNCPHTDDVTLSIKWRHFVNAASRSGMSDLGSKWVKLASNTTNPGLFRSNFSTCWLGDPTCTEIWPEKVPYFSHFGPNLRTLSPNLTPLVLVSNEAKQDNNYLTGDRSIYALTSELLNSSFVTFVSECRQFSYFCARSGSPDLLADVFIIPSWHLAKWME